MNSTATASSIPAREKAKGSPRIPAPTNERNVFANARGVEHASSTGAANTTGSPTPSSSPASCGSELVCRGAYDGAGVLAIVQSPRSAAMLRIRG